MKTYKQTDWALQHTINCGHCSRLFLARHAQVGRTQVYCSDACKMRAYRLRSGALRNDLTLSGSVTKSTGTVL